MKGLLDEGLISHEDFEKKKGEILDSIFSWAPMGFTLLYFTLLKVK